MPDCSHLLSSPLLGKSTMASSFSLLLVQYMGTLITSPDCAAVQIIKRHVQDRQSKLLICALVSGQLRTGDEKLNAIYTRLSFADQDNFSGDVSFGCFEI